MLTTLLKSSFCFIWSPAIIAFCFVAVAAGCSEGLPLTSGIETKVRLKRRAAKPNKVAVSTAADPLDTDCETTRLLPLKEVSLRYIFSGKANCNTPGASQQDVVLLTPKDSTRFKNAYQLRILPLKPNGAPDSTQLATFKGEWIARKGSVDKPDAIILDFYRGRRATGERIASYWWAVGEHTLQPVAPDAVSVGGRAVGRRKCVLRLRRTEELF